MVTVDSLISTYAPSIANEAGVDPADYNPTAGGLASLLRDTAEQLATLDQTRDWLEDAATNLEAIARLGDNGPRTRDLLARISTALYNARGELANA